MPRPLSAWVLLMVVTLVTLASGRPVPDGIVRNVGGRLELDGKPFVFTGVNVWNANTPSELDVYGCGGPVDLASSAAQFGPGVKVVRAWFFQRLATTPDGRRDWTTFDATVAAAREHGIKLILVLGNQWHHCEGSGAAAAGYKNDQWYRDGYVTARPPGLPNTYRDWVAEVVRRYRDDPSVMLWQLMNEAEAARSVDGPCEPRAAELLRAFAADMSRLVKRVDPSHLVGLGTIGGGQCGASGPEYAEVQDLDTLDVVEYHDYSLDEIPGDRWNGLAVRLEQARALGKPLIVGEMGVAPSEVGGLMQRAALVRRKIEAQLRAGAVGVLLWSWHPAAPGGGQADKYDIAFGDPVLRELAALATSGGGTAESAHRYDR